MFLILLIAYAYNGASFKLPGFLIIVNITAVLFLSVLYLYPYFQAARLIRKIIVSEESALEQKRLIVVDEGINIESSTETMLLTWESFISVGANGHFVYLLLAGKKYLLLPRHNFESDKEVLNFLETVKNNISRIRGAGYENDLARGKPPYLLGLICLIPVIGALMGLLLLLYGIFKYKDKWLIIIGLAGMIWTAGISGAVVYYYKTSFGQKHMLAAASQDGLDSLAKAVEFYKIKNGAYPDSLMQLSEDSSTVMIMDPLRFTDANSDFKHVEFMYKKVGDHYYLFSSGIDGIPNTNDDIYPELDPADDSKFGLIKKSY